MAMADPTRSPPLGPLPVSLYYSSHSHESNDRNSRRRFLRRGYFGDAAQIGTQYRDQRQGERRGGGGTLMISRPPAGFVNFMI